MNEVTVKIKLILNDFLTTKCNLQEEGGLSLSEQHVPSCDIVRFLTGVLSNLNII